MQSPILVDMKFGSHLYGLQTSQSDVDYKGVYLPTLDQLLLGNYARSIQHSTGPKGDKNAPGDIDRELIALPRFVGLAVSGETVALDMLHCDSPESTSDIWEELVSRRTEFYSRKLSSFVGYVHRQAAKYGIKGSRLAAIKQVIEFIGALPAYSAPHVTLKDIWDDLPQNQFAFLSTETGKDGVKRNFYVINQRKYQDTLSVERVFAAVSDMYDRYGRRAKEAERNNGIDWKAISHALRAGYQARDIYLKGDFSYPLDETEFLLDVKLGRLDFKKDVAPYLENLVDEVTMLAKHATFPEQINPERWDAWLLEKYYQQFLNITYRRQ